MVLTARKIAVTVNSHHRQGTIVYKRYKNRFFFEKMGNGFYFDLPSQVKGLSLLDYLSVD